jgi:hypothetical protein
MAEVREFQIAGCVPETDDAEEFEWVDGRTFDDYEVAKRALEKKRRMTRLDGEMWIEVRIIRDWERIVE